MLELLIFLFLFYFDALFTHYILSKKGIKEEANLIHKLLYSWGIKKGLFVTLVVYSVIALAIASIYLFDPSITIFNFTIYFYPKILITILIALYLTVAILNILGYFSILKKFKDFLKKR